MIDIADRIVRSASYFFTTNSEECVERFKNNQSSMVTSVFLHHQESPVYHVPVQIFITKVQGITIKNEQFIFAQRKCHRRKMINWTAHSVAKLVFIQQVDTEDPLKNIHGRRMVPRSLWSLTRLYSEGSNYRQIQQILLQNVFKRSFDYTSNVVNCNCDFLGSFTSRHTVPGHGSWKRRCRMVYKLSSEQIQHLKAIHRKKVLIKFMFPFVHS